MSVLELSDAELRILRALRRGPLYAGALELILGELARRDLERLVAVGCVERALDIGPDSWRITSHGLEELDGRAR